jgi:hypothetical protein
VAHRANDATGANFFLMRRHGVTRCVSRKSHSYLAQRVSANPANLILVAAAFSWGCYMSYRDEGLTGELWFAMALAVLILIASTLAYLRFFRRINAVRIFVTPYGLVYRDHQRVLRIPRRNLLSVERLPSGPLGRWRVRATTGVFEFDGRLVSAMHLTQLLDGWLTLGRWEIGPRS